MSLQSRRVCITYNNYPAEAKEPPGALQEHCTAGIWGREVAPETGTPHIQGYLFLAKKTTIAGTKALLTATVPGGSKIHIEFAKGNTKQNRDYCKKGGDFTEWGIFPTDGEVKEKEKRKREDGEDVFKETWDLAVEGELGQVRSEHKIKYWRTLKEIAADTAETPQDLDHESGIWIYGHSGHGKSHAARHLLAPELHPYIKDKTKWWGGATRTTVDKVIIDDVSPEHAKSLCDELKIWADKYPFNPEVKGGHLGMVRPKVVIVTSQYRIEEVFKDRRTAEAMQRRFKFIELRHKWDTPEAKQFWTTYNARLAVDGWRSGGMPPVPQHGAVAGGTPDLGRGDSHGVPRTQSSTSSLSLGPLTLLPDLDNFDGYWS